MLVRLLVVAACAGATALLGTHLADERACEGARLQLFGLGARGPGPEGGVGQAVRTVSGRCHDPDDVAGAAASLIVARRTAAGRMLARRAVDRGPDQFLGWVALEAALRRDDPAGARAAAARARALNPQWSGPVRLP